MATLLPVAVYGLEVSPGDVMTPASPNFSATFRITMAAIDPSATIQPEEVGEGSSANRATLKIVRCPPNDDDSDDTSEGEARMMALMNGADSDELDEEDEEETNGGPSDPSKSMKARREKALAEIKKSLDEDSDDEMDVDQHGSNGLNGIASKNSKGKTKAAEDKEEDEDQDDLDVEEFVICTLDPVKNYQQPLDITIGEDEQVFFKVYGSHTVYLTGNYVVPPDEAPGNMDEIYDPDDEDDYDLSPGEEIDIDDEESDELDGLENPRITELGPDDDEEVSRLTPKKDKGKSKNKRPAEDEGDEPANLDDIMAKSLKPAEAKAEEEPKLSKKQLKKLKNNAGQSVPATSSESTDKANRKATVDTGKEDKKVHFAKNLENEKSEDKKSEAKPDAKKDAKKDEKPKATLGVKVVQGVTIDDKKLGTGPAAKKGDTVAMRYIGKLQSDNSVFDANKAGPPFKFKLGIGEVIKGWDIGVAGMSVRGERRIKIPANLGYGKKAMDKIPANSTLVFDIKLLSIN